MHILLVPSWYSTPDNPIRGSFFYDQASALHKAGHQVGILVPPTKFRTWHGLTEFRRHWRHANTDILTESNADIPVYRIPWWGWKPTFNQHARGELGLNIFDRYCHVYGQPDILHAHSILYGGYIAAYVGQHRPIPTVLTEHSTVLITGPILWGQPEIIRYTLNHVDRCLAVGPRLQSALNAFAPQKDIQILGNVVDTGFFAPIDQLQPTTTPFTFAVIGSLIPRKGVDVLLQAFHQAFQAQSVHLLVIGTGKQRQQLEHQSTSLGISGQVTFTGRQSRDQVRAMILRSHAVVSASHVETFAVNLIEALACGKPVIATRSGGPEMFVTDTNGLLVPPGDVNALAAAMRRLVGDYDRYDPAQIRDECVAHFSEKAIVGRLEEIYQEVLSR